MEKDFEITNIDELEFEGNEIVDFKKIFGRNNFTSLYVELKPNKAVPLHAHDDNDQSAIVLEGSGEYLVKDKKIKVSKGSSWFVKAGVQHSLINTGNKKLRYFEFIL